MPMSVHNIGPSPSTLFAVVTPASAGGIVVDGSTSVTPATLGSVNGVVVGAAPPASPSGSMSSGSSEATQNFSMWDRNPLASPVINDLGLVVDVCYNITDRWLECRDTAVLHLRHRLKHTTDLLSRPAGSFDVGDMRFLFDDEFTERTPQDTWFPHGLVPYDCPFEEDTLETLLYFYHIFKYETFLRQVGATDGPSILKLFSMMWNPALAIMFFNALTIPEDTLGVSRFFDRCSDMMRPRQWELCWELIQAKFRQLQAADRGTRNRLGRLGFPVEACGDYGFGLPPFLPAVGKAY